MSSESHTARNLLSDDPRDGSSERPDELGREGFAEYLGRLLENVREQSASSVLALIGDWGSGKTSVLELLRQRLSADDAAVWLLADFNPWTYPDAASLQRGFFNELTAALPKNDRPSGARAKVGGLARAISPIGKLGGLVGVDAEGAIQALADLVLGDASASAAKRAAESALRRVKRPILMVIDDLDRLTPAELLEVLKLVRLIGRLPHVYYLLCYDERTLLDVLQRTEISGGDESRARAYLEKIVQVRLDMPALRESQRSRLLDQGLISILDSNAVLLPPADKQRLNDVYFSVLDRRLTTPRAITRFLGQVQAFFAPLRGEVDFVDYFLVSWLRTEEPGVYTMLQRDRDALLGRYYGDWSIGRRDADAAAGRRQFWQDRINGAQVEAADQDGVIRVLSGLFPEVAAAFTSSASYTTASERRTPKAISHPDYFDRYVSFGVPDDDLPDSVVGRALADLTNHTTSTALDRLTNELQANASRTIRKIDASRDAGTPMPEVALFELIARTWPDVDRERSEIFVDPQRAAERGAALCLLRMDREIAVQTAERVAAQPERGPFVVNVVRQLHRDKRSPYSDLVPADDDLIPLAQVATAAIKRWYDTHPAASPFDEGAMSSFWAWTELDSSGARAWLRNQVDNDHWSLQDAVGALTSVATSIGEPGGRRSIGDFQLAEVDEVFGLSRVFSELGPALDTTVPFHGDPLDTPATPKNRTHYAMARLQQTRAERTPPPEKDGDPTEAPDTHA
jgi:predicted KAP-like P-loop ATPase